jgi:hypothetical protein
LDRIIVSRLTDGGMLEGRHAAVSECFSVTGKVPKISRGGGLHGTGNRLLPEHVPRYTPGIGMVKLFPDRLGLRV